MADLDPSDPENFMKMLGLLARTERDIERMSGVEANARDLDAEVERAMSNLEPPACPRCQYVSYSGRCEHGLSVLRPIDFVRNRSRTPPLDLSTTRSEWCEPTQTSFLCREDRCDAGHSSQYQDLRGVWRYYLTHRRAPHPVGPDGTPYPRICRHQPHRGNISPDQRVPDSLRPHRRYQRNRRYLYQRDLRSISPYQLYQGSTSSSSDDDDYY